LPSLIAVRLGVYSKSKVQDAWRLVKIFFRPNQKKQPLRGNYMALRSKQLVIQILMQLYNI
ncbi:hypothetical protein L6J37_21135, partial [Photobacterium sp. WH77]|uniref:hypothetical protein n=1 Tax=unclassified Photobacterium TaxID=2628852 RepID=UPI001EDBF7FC